MPRRLIERLCIDCGEPRLIQLKEIQKGKGYHCLGCWKKHSVWTRKVHTHLWLCKAEVMDCKFCGEVRPILGFRRREDNGMALPFLEGESTQDTGKPES